MSVVTVGLPSVETKLAGGKFAWCVLGKLGKARNGIPPALNGRQLAIVRIKQLKNTLYAAVPSALDHASKSSHNELPAHC